MGLYQQIRFNAGTVRDNATGVVSRYRIILTKDSILHDLADPTDVIDITNGIVIGDEGNPISYKDEENGILMRVEIGELQLLSNFAFSGTCNGSPVSHDLTSTKVTLLENFHDDIDSSYRIWYDRQLPDNSWENRFVGDYKREDVKHTTLGIISRAGTTSEASQKTTTIKAAPLLSLLRDLTFKDIFYSIEDSPSFVADNAPAPFVAGFRIGNNLSSKTNGLVTKHNNGSDVVFNADAGKRAYADLFFSTNPSNNDTVTIGSKTYTFKTTLSNVDGYVKLGTNAFFTALNLLRAVNLYSGGGSVYAAAMTANSDAHAADGYVSLESGGTGARMRFYANVTGTAGNSIVSTSSLTSVTSGFKKTTFANGETDSAVFTYPEFDTEHYGVEPTGVNRIPYVFGISVYTLFHRIFNDARINFTFTSSDYDLMPVKTYSQRYDAGLYPIDETSGKDDIQELCLNNNVFFGESPNAILIDSSTNNTVVFKTNHNFVTGQKVWGDTFAGVTTDTQLIGTFKTITVVNDTTITIDDYVGTGTSDGGIMGLMQETPVSFKEDTDLEEIVTYLCIACGFKLEITIVSDQPKVFLRRRDNDVGVALPASFENYSSGEKTEEEFVPSPSLSLKYKGDNGKIWIDHKEKKEEDKTELEILFRNHALANVEGYIHGRHLIYDSKIPITEQVKCEIILDNTYHKNFPEGFVAGTNLSHYEEYTGANDPYGETYGTSLPNIGVYGRPDGYFAQSICQLGADTTARTSANFNFGEEYIYCIGQFYGNVLRLYRTRQVRATYNRITNDAGEINWLRNGVTHTFFWDGAVRNWVALEVEVNDIQQTVDILWGEVITDYIVFKVFKEGEGGSESLQTATAPSSSDNDTGDEPNDESDLSGYLAKTPNSATRNAAQPTTPDYSAIIAKQFSSLQVADLFPNVTSADVILSGFNNAGNLFFVETGGGTDRIVIKAPSSIAASFTLTLPNTDGNANDVLISDGSGNLSFVDVDTLVSVTPAGLDTYVQYNDGLVFGGDAGFLFNETTDALTLGVSSSTTGSIILKNAANANTLTLRSGVTSSSYTFTLPTTAGTNTYLLQTDGSGNTSWVAPPSLADAVILNPLSTARNLIDLTGDYNGIKIQAFSSQTNYLLYLENSSAAFLGGFNDTAKLVLRGTTSDAAIIQVATTSTDVHGIHIKVRGTPASSDSIFRIHDSTAATTHLIIGGTGLIGMNGTADTNAILRIVSSTGASGIGLKIKADSNSSSRPFVIENSSAAVIGGLSYDGVLSVGLDPNTAGIGMLRIYQASTTGAMMRYTTLKSATTNNPVRNTLQRDVVTTDATVTTLYSFSASSNTSYQVEVEILARKTNATAGNTAGYKLMAAFKDVSGTTTQIGATTVLHSVESDATWNATIDNSGTSIRVRVTGAASNTISWMCHVSITDNAG